MYSQIRIVTNIALSLVLMMTMSISAADSYPGYTLVASSQNIYLYDMDGNIAHSWSASGKIETTPYLLPDGSILVPVRNGRTNETRGGAHPHGLIEKYDWDGNLTWSYTISDGAYDIEPMPNGNVMSIVHTDSWGSSEPGKLVEIQPSGTSGGTEVWECSVTDLLGSGGYLNSVSYDPRTDLLAVTVQESQRTLAIIDHSDGSLVAKYVLSSGRVHGCQWSMSTYPGTDIEIADDYVDTSLMNLGTVLCVSNQMNQALEIKINGSSASLSNSWSYSFSDHQGGVQRLPNGNLFITKGTSSTMTEIDSDGNTVWELTTSSTNRNYRYGMNYPGLYELTGVSLVNDNISLNTSQIRSIQILKGVQKGRVNIAVQGYSKEAMMNLYSAKGELLRTLHSDDATFHISTKDFAKGLYFANIAVGSDVLTSRITIAE